MPLYELKAKQRGIIEEVPAMGLLNSLGVRKGMAVSVMSRQPLGGPIVVKLGSTCLAMARDVAEQIEVKEVC